MSDYDTSSKIQSILSQIKSREITDEEAISRLKEISDDKMNEGALPTDASEEALPSSEDTTFWESEPPWSSSWS